MSSTVYLRPGNAKLGQGFVAWSIPAVETCPGSSESCRKACYAAAGHYHFSSVRDALKANLEHSKSPNFANAVVAELRRSRPSQCRIHVAGDFYSAGYVAKWINIVARTPYVQFLAYTRSWRVPEQSAGLRSLAVLPNMSLWLSEDADTGPAPAWEATHRAYMARTDFDAANTPEGVSLVFRVSRRTVLKRAAGRVVCPAENGVAGKLKHTCTSCRLCLFKECNDGVGGRRAALDDARARSECVGG